LWSIKSCRCGPCRCTSDKESSEEEDEDETSSDETDYDDNSRGGEHRPNTTKHDQLADALS